MDRALFIGESLGSVLEQLKRFFPKDCHDRLFLVGGAVRDCILGQESHDVDLAGLLSILELNSLGFRLVEAKSASPIWFRAHPIFGKLELTLLDGAGDIAKDLHRRDFTINAMAISMGGEIIDPLGGRSDLEARQLRTCSVTAFLDDPVRIFRAFRFEAEGWRMAPEAERQVREQDWSESLAKVPLERFSLEMMKALEKPDPARFFTRMLDFGVGAEFLPELFRMGAVSAGPLQYHPEGDLLTHSLQVLERVSLLTSDPVARFCAMFHDLGKLGTDPSLHPRHHGHEETGGDMAPKFCNRMRLPVTFRRALTWTCRLHGKANRWVELRDATRIGMAERAVKAGVEEILPLIAAADKPVGAGMQGWSDAVRIIEMSATELGIDPMLLECLVPIKRSALVMQWRVERLRRDMSAAVTGG